MLENIVVAVILLLVAVMVGWSFWRVVTGRAKGCGGCCSHPSADESCECEKGPENDPPNAHSGV